MKQKTIRMAASLLAAILLYMPSVQGLEVSARSAALLDGDTGQILWEKNAQDPSLIASTTKIMTALVVLEQAELDEVVEIPAEAVGVEGSSMYLKEGEQLTVEDLLYGLMLSSGNDAAVALAIYVSGSIEAFAEEMNRKAEELGLQNTHFANPNGLDQEGHYATAESLGQITVAALQNPDFRTIVSAKSYACAGHSMTNHNKLLWQYPGAMGVKTGFTKQAGRILVGAAERDGRCLVSVTIHAPSDWSDHAQMLDYGFSLYSSRTLVTEGEEVGQMPVISGLSDSVPLVAEDTLAYTMLEEETAEYRLLTAPFVYAPVEQGATMGTLQAYVGGRLVVQTPVYAAASVEQLPEEPGFWDKLLEKISG